jgi:hypothetical protein
MAQGAAGFSIKVAEFRYQPLVASRPAHLVLDSE